MVIRFERILQISYKNTKCYSAETIDKGLTEERNIVGSHTLEKKKVNGFALRFNVPALFPGQEFKLDVQGVTHNGNKIPVPILVFSEVNEQLY